jgi:thiol-disulfide isomerase/thioredoxin
MRISILFLLLVLSGPSHAYPQPARLVSGMVISGEGSGPLEGVAVGVKGTNIISGSQQDGMFYIEVPANDSILVFAHDEYQTAEIRLAAGNEYHVVLNKGRSLPQTRTALSVSGAWRAVFEIRPGVEVPFNFEIRTTEGGGLKAFFRNADEWFEGGRVLQTTDSLYIFLDQFDNELAFRRQPDGLSGVLRRQDGTGSPLLVRATPGVVYRFEDHGIPPSRDISGTYDITFTTANGKEEKSVGVFRQQGNKLSGTFLHITGDSRYLEGIVEGNDFYLSSFFGSGPAYYKGTITTDGHLTGETVGVHGGQQFTGVLNAAAALPDPYRLTYLKEGYSSFDFSFPDVNGHLISPRDEKFRNKVVIVTIGGTWCPNCVDETSFLAPFYKANQARGVEVISIQYERQTDSAFVRKVLTRMRQRYDIQYDQVLGGVADKQAVAASLPALNTFLAFPTTIFIDKKGRVAKIHTGYTGPATGQYYQDFVKEFTGEVDTLLRE